MQITCLSFDNGKAVNEPPPLTIPLRESGKSFMFLAIPSSAITLQAR
jgi:hypothetical protein